jgi:hypothetical protein
VWLFDWAVPLLTAAAAAAHTIYLQTGLTGVTHIGAKKDLSAVINAALAGGRNAAHLECAVGDMNALTHRWEKGLNTAGCTTALATYKKLHEDRPTAGWLVLLKFCLASVLYCAAPAAQHPAGAAGADMLYRWTSASKCAVYHLLPSVFHVVATSLVAEEGFTADNMPNIEETYSYIFCSALL